MKKLMCIILVSALLILSACTGNAPEFPKNEVTVATSFYPVYIFTLNLLDGIEKINVKCMAEQSVGCLHDYNLTAKDARLLSDAKLFVINGAGMEGFLQDAFQSVENLKVIDSSENIALICNEAHHHNETEHNDHHHDNSHIWLSVDNAKLQVENIKEGLVKEFPQHEESIENNYKAYIERLNILIEKRDSVSLTDDFSVVSFHGAFEYLAEDTGFHIVNTIESDEGAEPSAKELAHLSDEIKKQNTKALFVEPDYSGSAAEILSRETNVKIYTLNPVISGEVSLTAYEDIMNENYDILKAVK